MKKQLVVSGNEIHRVVIAFLLEETQRHYFLARRTPGLEEDLLKTLIEENKRQLPAELLALVNQSTWWRRVCRAIEDCGLNHWDIIQAAKNPNKYDKE